MAIKLNPKTGKKWTMEQDMKQDMSRGIKEGSKKDMKIDKSRGLPKDKPMKSVSR